MSRDERDALGRALNRVGVGGGSATGRDRQMLEARLAVIERALKPCPEWRIVQIVASMASMPARAEVDPQAAQFAFDQQVDNLGDIPEWALALAASSIVRGEARLGHRFRPSIGDIRGAAFPHTAPLVDERAKTLKALGESAEKDPPPDPARRKTLADLARGVAQKVAEGGAVAEATRLGRPVDDLTGPKAETRSVKGMPDGPEKDAIAARHAARVEQLAAEYARTPPTIATPAMMKIIDGMRAEKGMPPLAAKRGGDAAEGRRMDDGMVA